MQNTINSGGGGAPVHHSNSFPSNSGGFGHQMAQTGAVPPQQQQQQQSGQYNHMLLNQQYLNFGFPMNYANNQVGKCGKTRKNPKKLSFLVKN